VVLLRFVSLSKQRLENEMRSLKSASFNFFVVKPDIQAAFAPCKHAMWALLEAKHHTQGLGQHQLLLVLSQLDSTKHHLPALFSRHHQCQENVDCWRLWPEMNLFWFHLECWHCFWCIRSPMWFCVHLGLRFELNFLLDMFAFPGSLLSDFLISFECFIIWPGLIGLVWLCFHSIVVIFTSTRREFLSSLCVVPFTTSFKSLLPQLGSNPMELNFLLSGFFSLDVSLSGGGSFLTFSLLFDCSSCGVHWFFSFRWWFSVRPKKFHCCSISCHRVICFWNIGICSICFMFCCRSWFSMITTGQLTLTFLMRSTLKLAVWSTASCQLTCFSRQFWNTMAQWKHSCMLDALAWFCLFVCLLISCRCAAKGTADAVASSSSLLCHTHPFWMSEPDNCSIKKQSGSTNSKGLPVLFQGLPPRNATKWLSHLC